MTRVARSGRTPPERDGAGVFGLLLVDAVLLAVLELFYLPLRLDGALLPQLGYTPVPVSALVALVTTPLLVRHAALLVGARLAAVPLVLWLATLLLVGLLGPGGDRVLLSDWRTPLLLLCGALPGAAVLGRRLGATRPTPSGSPSSART